MHKSFVVIVIIVAALFGGIFILNKDKSSSTAAVGFTVVMKENANDKMLDDIFLVDQDGKETLFTTTSSVHRGHYHVTEYHNGNIYLLKRTGFVDGKPVDENWTDELWKFDENKRETKLFSAKGLDFRIATGEKHGAIFFADPSQQGILDIAMFDKHGTVTKTLNSASLGLAKYDLFIFPLFWAGDNLWFTAGNGPAISVVNKIDANKDFSLKTYDVSVLPVQGLEFTLNPDKEIIAFSDFPVLFDKETADQFTASKKTVTLFTYDLDSKEKEIIATSVAKPFHPAWFDPDTLEYDDPNAEVRIVKEFE